MQTKRRDLFTTVRTEGAILPADLLQRIADGDSGLEGLKPEDFHRAGERLNEVINGAWNRLLGQWQTFQAARAKLPENDAATSVTRERWLLPLFRELDYGRLATTAAIEINGKSYPISHGWQKAPIHLVGWRIEMDRRTAGVAGAARTSPHSLVQELLNQSDDHLWGFVSNGQRLRILRDNISLTRQAFVEFDLEAMMDGEVYADFALLWLLCHQSRVEGDRPEQCWLEKWSRTAQETGTRALDSLRQGVEDAIKALGRGFLAHPANASLRQKLRDGAQNSGLDTQEYYRQVLRLVYRLLFLFAAEDRGLLLLPSAGEKTRADYARYYSTGRLRHLAERHRGTRHCDLYQGLALVMQKLGTPGGCPELGLPALGSFLWSDRAMPDLDGSGESGVGSREEAVPASTAPTPDSRFPTPCKTANADLLEAVRALAFTVDGNVLRAVDYKNLGAEELGSVYESLLELHPKINADAATFELDVAAGHERKTTGSYYTPTSLINCLLDSALDPILDEAVKGEGSRESGVGSRDKAGSGESGIGSSEQKLPSPARGRGVGGEGTSPTPDSRLPTPSVSSPTPYSLLPTPSTPESRILALKICDPACGSGHFLIAAAHRIAKRLAAVRTGDEEPAPEAYREALRDVIGRCIFGVDINPMAVELCKINLWLESLEPGKPLSFLDHHIQCGNSLLGATPALLNNGIPDEAFTPIEGDDRKLCSEYKKQNRDERRGQKTFFTGGGKPWERMGDFAVSLANLEQTDDASLEGVRSKEERYAQLVGSADYLSGRFWADTWCAAFVWKKTKEFDYAITENVFRRIERNPHDCAPWMRQEIQRLARQYQFFHWHLAFPQVFRVPADDEEPENEQTGWSGGFDLVVGNPPWVRQESLKSIKQLLSPYSSYRSTADSSVYFLELGANATRRNRQLAMLTPNKWLRASYAEPLRVLLRENATLRLLVDFGHSRTLFPGADTFPAAVTLQITRSPARQEQMASFVRAHDTDRQFHTLPELIQTHSVAVPHANLRPSRWQMEPEEVSNLLDRLMNTGCRLSDYLRRRLLSGLKTGFNKAFYVDDATRADLVGAHPQAATVVRKFLRGRDIKRWRPVWDRQWHIVIPSSENMTWPWSSCPDDATAERVFADAYPTIHRHLKQYEERLRARQDVGKYWWELRSCDYYDEFAAPKIVVQCIAYYSRFAYDAAGDYVNNKVIVIPADDLYLLAVLNSRIAWWIINRTFQHMKDEGLSVDVQFLEALPIPSASVVVKAEIENTVRRLISVLPSEEPADRRQIDLELRLDHLMRQAFEMSEREAMVVEQSLPPRDPIATLDTEEAEEVVCDADE